MKTKRPSKAEVLQAIHRGRGLLKGKMGDQPFAEWWAEHKREELALEEAKLARHSLRPLTAKPYDSLHGCLKGKRVLEALLEDRRQERER